MLLGDHVLAVLDLFVHELHHFAGLHAHHMVVVLFIGQLEHGGAALEIVAQHDAGLLELGQHPVNRGQAHVLAGIH